MDVWKGLKARRPVFPGHLVSSGSACGSILGQMFAESVCLSLQTMLTAISMSAIATNGVVPGEGSSACGP